MGEGGLNLSSNVHPGIDEIDNNLHSVRFSGQLTKIRASAKHLKEQLTHRIPYIIDMHGCNMTPPGSVQCHSDPLDNICHQMSTP